MISYKALKRILVRSSVLMLILVMSCLNGPDLILNNDSAKIEIELPEQLELTYRGLPIGDAELLNSQGDYGIFFFSGYQSTCDARYLLIKNDAFGFSYRLEVSEVLNDSKGTKKNGADTCAYLVDKKSIANGKLNSVLDDLKEFVDTLARMQKDSGSTYSVESK